MAMFWSNDAFLTTFSNQRYQLKLEKKWKQLQYEDRQIRGTPIWFADFLIRGLFSETTKSTIRGSLGTFSEIKWLYKEGFNFSAEKTHFDPLSFKKGNLFIKNPARAFVGVPTCLRMKDVNDYN